MATTTLQELADVTGAARAVNYIRSQLQTFAAVPARIAALRRRALTVQSAAARQRNGTAATTATTTLAGLQKLESLYDSTASKLQTVLQELHAAGFGFVPIALAIGVIAVAGIMAYLFQQLDYHERVLTDVEKGVLTAEQATALQKSGGPSAAGLVGAVLGGGGVLVPLVAVGAGLWFLSGHPGRRRDW